MPKTGRPVTADRIADVAAAARILAARGVVDGFGHVSMRHPDAPDRYLMSRALAPALVASASAADYASGAASASASAAASASVAPTASAAVVD